MHDIGKAIDREMDGTHLQIGIDLLRKFGETEEVVHAMACHHGDYDPQTVEAVLVTAADALSAARPGARREVLETYVKRLEKLEEIAGAFKGVQKTFAIQAGREIRIIVDSGKIGDEQALWLSQGHRAQDRAGADLPGPDQGDRDPRDPIRRVRPLEARDGSMKLLFVGDVIGKPGRRALQNLLPRLVDRHNADFVVVNVENSAGGFGVTPEVMAEIADLPIHCFTSGNHVWDKKEGVEILDRDPRLLRPANYPEGNAGKGLYIGETAAGIPVAVINLEGQVFMSNLESPFRVADRLLQQIGAKAKVVFVDFHAEATSEKQALGFYLDGRVSAVVGTHTHVPTADERILPNGTAYLTDAGMTGPYESVIGMRVDKVLKRFLLQTPSSFEVAKRDVRLAGVVIDIDEDTGKARGIERLLVKDAQE